MSHFFDFDTRKDNQIEPKSTREDIFNGDKAPVLCDICPNGIRLEVYLGDKLICPNCMTVTDPTFSHVLHDTIETTIEEYAETHSGELSYVSEKADKPHLTRIRKKLQEEEALPDYVKKEIEFIKWRPGYKVVPMKKEKLSDRTNK
jgi:hypothetical protein